jgi:hypothetical protein
MPQKFGGAHDLNTASGGREKSGKLFVNKDNDGKIQPTRVQARTCLTPVTPLLQEKRPGRGV